MRDTLKDCLARIDDGSGHVHKIFMMSDESGVTFTAKRSARCYRGWMRDGVFFIEDESDERPFRVANLKMDNFLQKERN